MLVYGNFLCMGSPYFSWFIGLKDLRMAFSIIRAYMGPLFTAQTGFQKLMGGPISITGFPLNNFCVNHEVKGFFFNLKYAH